MTLRGLPNVLDIRTVGLAAGIDLASKPEGVGRRGVAAMQQAFDAGLVIRVTGDTIALAPPLIASERRDRGNLRHPRRSDRRGGVKLPPPAQKSRQARRRRCDIYAPSQALDRGVGVLKLAP